MREGGREYLEGLVQSQHERMVASNHHILLIQHINGLLLCYYLAFKHGLEGVHVAVRPVRDQIDTAEGAASEDRFNS